MTQITKVHVKRSFPARQYRGSLVVEYTRVIVFDIDETSRDAYRTSECAFHLRALRCNHWREYLIQQRISLRIAGGWCERNIDVLQWRTKKEREQMRVE